MDVANKEIIGFVDQLRAIIGNGKRILRSTYRHLENYLALALMSYVFKLFVTVTETAVPPVLNTTDVSVIWF